MKNYWENWWKAAGIRALKTIGQAGVTAFGTVAFDAVSWKTALIISLGAGVASLCTSLAGLPELGNAGEPPKPDDAKEPPELGDAGGVK